jgi:TonB family protein
MTMRTLMAAAMLGAVLAGAAPVDARQLPTAARLRAGATAPLAPRLIVGGGEVVLDLTVGADGQVSKVEPVRTTPPYTDLLVGAVRGWRFDPPKAPIKGTLQPGEGHVLVVAMYRPPQVYAAPARGKETRTVGELSPELPAPAGLAMPTAYPPRAAHDGAVLIEMELTMAGVVRGTKVMSQPSTFDSAALETVRAWRFDIPRRPAGAEQVFVYAVVGFREPITP